MRALLILFLFALPAWAEVPLACDPKEDVVVCELKVERNNAMDELAQMGGNLRREQERAAKVAAWWQSYVAGVQAQLEWWAEYGKGVSEARLTRRGNVYAR